MNPVGAQACQKELSQQKAAYERAISELMEKQQRAQSAKHARAAQDRPAKESAAEALRSHPLAETPPRGPLRGPPVEHHESPCGGGEPQRMPVLRSRCGPAQSLLTVC